MLWLNTGSIHWNNRSVNLSWIAFSIDSVTGQCKRNNIEFKYCSGTKYLRNIFIYLLTLFSTLKESRLARFWFSARCCPPVAKNNSPYDMVTILLIVSGLKKNKKNIIQLVHQLCNYKHLCIFYSTLSWQMEINVTHQAFNLGETFVTELHRCLCGGKMKIK